MKWTYQEKTGGLLELKHYQKKLKIPYDILIEIKLKYCPNTRKVVRKQILKSILKENAGNEKAENMNRQIRFKRIIKIEEIMQILLWIIYERIYCIL